MAKRRLSKNQSRRIKQQQDTHIKRAHGEEHDNASYPEERGRVVAHYGTQVEVESASGDVVRCFMRANLATIATGDKVIFRHQENTGVVVSIEERKSLLCRPDSYGKLKPVAANVDQVLITIAPLPEPFANLIDRYIVIAELNRIKPAVLINKSELIDSSNKDKIDWIRETYRHLGYQVFTVSAKNDDSLYNTLENTLADKTSIFVGQSGVGKSSIIQRLVPEERIRVGELSEAKTKGRHTTTHSRLFQFSGGGECIDSPGIREFGLWHLDADQVIDGFVELSALAGRCKFRDCQHQEEPSCALREAVEA